MKHGYYIAKADCCYGDEDYCDELKETYERHANKDEDEKPRSVDGASRYDSPNGLKVVVIVDGEVKIVRMHLKVINGELINA